MLDNLGMIGVSWRPAATANRVVAPAAAQTEALAAFTLDQAQLETALRAFAEAEQLPELAYIATCNRVELIFCTAPGSPARDLRPAAYRLLTGHAPGDGEAERRLRAWQGEGAAEHLFLVAAGLDSAALGEAEIVGQVRSSMDLARSLGLIGPTLQLIYDEALRIAARVRGETALGQGRVSLAEIAVDAIRERLARTPGLVALLGVSPMTERAAKSLASAGIPFMVVNRTAERAQQLAHRFGGSHRTLDSFIADPPAIEALLSATGADDAVIREPVLERLAARSDSGEPPLVVDMAIPADISIDGCRKHRIERIGMDQIVERADRNRAFRLTEAAEAREQVDQALEALQQRIAERYYGPLMGALQRRYQRTAEEGVRRLLKRELRGLGTEEREAIGAWAEVLARRFAHIPALGLRGLMNAGPEGSVEAFLSGLEPEFADELREALNHSGEPSADRSLERRA